MYPKSLLLAACTFAQIYDPIQTSSTTDASSLSSDGPSSLTSAPVSIPTASLVPSSVLSADASYFETFTSKPRVPQPTMTLANTSTATPYPPPNTTEPLPTSALPHFVSTVLEAVSSGKHFLGNLPSPLQTQLSSAWEAATSVYSNLPTGIRNEMISDLAAATSFVHGALPSEINRELDNAWSKVLSDASSELDTAHSSTRTGFPPWFTVLPPGLKTIVMEQVMGEEGLQQLATGTSRSAASQSSTQTQSDVETPTTTATVLETAANNLTSFSLGVSSGAKRDLHAVTVGSALLAGIVLGGMLIV
ncbi:hypothetical protein K470DRAFT_26988 [Piedraia hortae CBS 480.64]|uniref:Uncharacterized protein n=1 Tax=Piedraia hortae CBS 480.64 TaxID=1314780 RepID=A0A6A7C423_9PEZI|nr:hypothetical protein K470DRAFT_26988 [Piedraia hortae CBS 480.64]